MFERNDMLKLDLQLFAEEAEDKPTEEVEEKQEEAKFTQDQVNSISSGQHKEGRAKGQRDTLNKLGFESLEEAEEAINGYKQWKESQQSEAERVEEELQKARDQIEGSNEKLANLEAENTALKLNVLPDSTQDAITLAKAYVDEETDIKAALEKVIEKYPQFTGQTETQQEEQKPKKWTQGTPSTIDSGASNAFDAVVEKYKKG